MSSGVMKPLSSSDLAPSDWSQIPVPKGYEGLAKLGDGHVFIRRTPGGFVKAVKALVTLYEEKGHLVFIQGKCSPSAAGYQFLNQVAGLSILTPATLQLPEGNTVVNPYPIIDPKSGSISKVWVRKSAVGLGPTGNLVITTGALLYDIGMYFAQDLFNKVKDNAKAGRLCMGSALTDEDKQKGIFAPIEGDLGVWADTSHTDVLRAIETFIQKKLFAERLAQTIAERNVLKKHPAIAVSRLDYYGPEKKRVTRVPVIGWTSDLTEEELEELARRAEMGEAVSAGGKVVEVHDVSGPLDDDDLAAAGEEQASEQEETGGSPAAQGTATGDAASSSGPRQDNFFGGGSARKPREGEF